MLYKSSRMGIKERKERRLIMNKILAIDIETMQNEAMINKLPKVTADSRLKDPMKIREDLTKKKAEQIEKMALSPLYGKIACIGYYGDELKEVDLQDEAIMIKTCLQRCDENTIFTWNGKGFDFEFIVKRGVILGVCNLLELKKYTDKYKATNHIDLMTEWAGYGKYAKLDEIASILLNGDCKEEFDFREIPELIKTPIGQEKIKSYCLQDCKLVYDLARKMGY